MKDVRNDELIRLSMKPVLAPDDEARLEAFLATHPEARATWEEERALGRALQSLPDVPVSSNFTARVLQAVDLEEAREARKQPGWFPRGWPRLGWATVAALVAVLGVQEWRGVKRAQLMKDVTLVSNDITKLPSAEVLRDFDAIQQLPSASDDELLIALR
jgi:anti-sigma factor RsiW